MLLPAESPGYTADSRATGMAHQAQAVKKEILSNLARPYTVSVPQKWPASDTLTTFAKAEMTRVLIEKNTFSIFSI